MYSIKKNITSMTKQYVPIYKSTVHATKTLEKSNLY